MPVFDPHIFRAYDIRGKVLGQLTAEACWWIGHAFGEVLREKYPDKTMPAVVVGRDARTHGPELETAVIDGLVAVGCSVKRIGVTPSPLNYFTICEQGFDGGVQVTASHNPKEYNGLKLQLRNAEAYAGEDLQDLRRRIEKSETREASRGGAVEDIDAIGPYVAQLESIFRGAGKGMHIIVDGGNGVAGPTYMRALKSVGAKVTGIYIEPDGEFPNHPADPSKHTTLAELQKKVAQEKADLGLAFDGDGDRVGVVDEKGSIVTSDQVLLLLARDHLIRHPGAPIIFTVSNSGVLETEIQRWGGRPIMCKVGHSFVEHAMREHGAKLGGEQSGHFFVEEDYYGFDDALVAALRLVSIVNAGKKPAPKKLSTLIAEFPKVFQMPEVRPHCADDAKAGVVARITAHFKKDHPVNDLDGARVDFGDGAWAGIRFSNTSPCLSICIEARSSEKLAEVEKVVLEHLRTYEEVEL